MAFYDPAGNYPAACDNGLFFADYTRSCIGIIPAGSGGLPDTAQAQVFATDAFGIVELDGVRVYLDGALVIDQWKDQSATTYMVSRTVPAGDHEVKVEYYENGGDAVAKVTIAP